MWADLYGWPHKANPVKPVRSGPLFFEPKATVLPYQRGGEAMSVPSFIRL